MPLFFNGRLWVSPATMSMVDDSAMYNKNPNVGSILCIIGKTVGGKPFTPLRFGSYLEAKAALIDGEPLKAIEKAFDPSSDTYGPSTVMFIRVNDETQSSRMLKDSLGRDSILLTSQGYGKYTNSIMVKVEAGSKIGRKLTTSYAGKYYSGDNIVRRAFTVEYVGAATTATFSCDNTTATLTANGVTVETFNLADMPTIQDLVDRINATDDFVAMVQENNGRRPSLNGLDALTNVSIKTKVTVTATIQACIDWFNEIGEPLLTATRAPNAAALPAPLPYSFLSGGSDGLTTMNEWANAFEVLQKEDVQWVVPIASDPAIYAMTESHCAYMSNIARMERRCILGTNSNTTDDQAIAAAFNINSDRASLVHIGFYDYNENGRLTLFPPYILAAQLAGMFAGVNPGTALTNKTLKVRGLERKLRNPTDTDDLINGGILCVEETNKGYKVVKSISTWLANDNYNRVEVSTGVACDFVSRSVREVLDDLRGKKGSPAILSEAISRVDSTLRELARPEPMGPGIIVGDKINPPFKNITASLDGDVLRVEFQCSPVIPVNYIPIVIHAVPYSGSASA